ncbi:MAG: LysR family transcriptional regulator [Desulfuromonadales bacterium]|nr:LysR family transcriptional regulator [Desulfuromonadales bacterium]
MTLDQMRMLVQIAESGSVLAAADNLHRTQPTVSMAIRKLEAEFDLQILDRSSYRARLTPVGEALYRRAKQVLQQAESFSITARQLAVGNEPELRVAIEASCPMPFALDLLRVCEQQFPETEFTLRGETLWGALERLRDGDVDLAITPWLDEDFSLDSSPLTVSRLVAVAAPGFAQRYAQDLLHLDDLRVAVQVVVRDSSRKPPETNFGKFELGRHWYVNDHQTKKEILLAGMGWGRLHIHMIASELAAGRLVPLQIADYPDTLDIEIRMVRRKGEVIGPVAAAFWEEGLNRVNGLQESGKTGRR